VTTLFIDSETTGLANFRMPPEHPEQPHVVQWGAILDDDSGRVIGEMNLIIRPDGWSVPTEASQIHGITTEIAQRHGLNQLGVTKLLAALIDRADVVVAHNMAFDGLMAAVEMYRLGMARELERWNSKPRFCTMESSTDVLKIPGKRGYKWPNLQEAHVHFVGSRFEGAHDAMEDVRACKRVYYRLKEFLRPQPAQLEMEVEL
jgi:DNA polymerase-3 subunit epsilon